MLGLLTQGDCETMSAVLSYEGCYNLLCSCRKTYTPPLLLNMVTGQKADGYSRKSLPLQSLLEEVLTLLW